MNTQLSPSFTQITSPHQGPKIPTRFHIEQNELIYEKLIGAGACGEVWLGTYIPKQLRVAIKKLYSIEFNDNDFKSWVREIEIHATLQNQFLLPFIGYTSSHPYTIITPEMPNGSLYDALHNPESKIKLNGTELTKIGYCIACGMRYLHDRHIMHRDLKSPNVLLDSDKLPKICDFGLSRTRELQSNLTKTVGTPQWMAPELIKCADYDESIDVYAYGVVLWEMLTGMVPFEGKESFQIIYVLLSDPNPHPIPPDAPEPLSNLIQKCVSQDPKSRPTFTDIISDFENHNVRFDGCDENSFNDLMMTTNESRMPVHLAHATKKRVRKASTSQCFRTPRQIPIPIPKDSNAMYDISPKKRKLSLYAASSMNNAIGDPESEFHQQTESPQESLFENIQKNLDLLGSSNIKEIEDGLLFFESNAENAYNFIATLPFWEQILRLCLSCSSDLEQRINHLMIQYAKIWEVLSSIKRVKNLHLFINSKTLDLFLYVVSMIPELIDANMIERLKTMVLETEQDTQYHSIILLCKIYQFVETLSIREAIITFFFSIVPKFSDKVGGHLVFLKLFSHWMNEQSPNLDNPLTDIIICLFIKSEIDENVIAAYHALFVLNKNVNSISVDVFSHLQRNEKLADCALDYLARVEPSTFEANIIDVLLNCFQMYNNQKITLLLCKIASKKPNIFFENDAWIKLRGFQAVAIFPVFLVLCQKRIDFFSKNENVPKFMCEVLKFDDHDSLPALCWALLKVKITPELAEKFESSRFIYIACQKIKKTKQPQSIIAGSKLISCFAKVSYSSSYQVIVQHLSRCAAEKSELGPICIKTLAILVKYPKLRNVFELCQVESIVNKYKVIEGLKEPIKEILSALSYS